MGESVHSIFYKNQVQFLGFLDQVCVNIVLKYHEKFHDENGFQILCPRLIYYTFAKFLSFVQNIFFIHY